MSLYVDRTRTGNAYAIYEDIAGVQRRVRGSYPTRDRALGAIPLLNESRRRRARSQAIDADVDAGLSVKEALARHPSPRGGKRAGSGRKPLDGIKPMCRRSVTLPDSVIATLEQRGGGNLSAGIRAAAELLAERKEPLEENRRMQEVPRRTLSTATPAWT